MLLKTSYLSVLLIILLYVLSGLLSKSLALIDGQNVFAVWIPTGVALAFLIFYKLNKTSVIGVLFGAFLFNSIVAGNSILLSMMIAIGNTIGPVVVAYLYMKKQEDGYILFHEQNVLILFIASIVGAIISSLNGTGSLLFHGIIPEVIVTQVIITWFTGDLLGYLIVTPILLYFLEKVWEKEILHLSNIKYKVVVFSFIMISVCFLVFFIPKGIESTRGFEALPVLFLILSTIFTGVTGSIFATIIFVLMAILGTILTPFSPFHITNENINTMLLLLQLYIGSAVMTIYFFVSNTYNRYKQLLELNEKDKMLQQQSKMAAMGEMLENIAHQWRQPLSVISSASSGIKLQKEYGALSDKSLFESLDMITNSAQHLSRTIDDFRDFYKTDTSAKPFSLKQTFEKSLDLVSSKLKNRLITTSLDFDDVKIYGYQNEMIQVFMNLVKNSIDAFEDIDEETKVIIVTTKDQNDSVVVSVQDNAGGIPQNIIHKVFDQRFTTKGDKDGTGIGLYMSKLIVEKSKGTIDVENKEFTYNEKKYLGACFLIRLVRNRYE